MVKKRSAINNLGMKSTKRGKYDVCMKDMRKWNF